MSTNKSIRDQIKLAELLKLVPNRFLLTAAASKRARQLIDGARPLIDATLEHNLPLDIALLEIQMGKIHISIEDSYYILDIGASQKFASIMHNISPCLKASRSNYCLEL